MGSYQMHWGISKIEHIFKKSFQSKWKMEQFDIILRILPKLCKEWLKKWYSLPYFLEIFPMQVKKWFN